MKKRNEASVSENIKMRGEVDGWIEGENNTRGMDRREERRIKVQRIRKRSCE